MVEDAVRDAITCSGCDARWTARNAAHCAAEKAIRIPLVPNSDGPGLFSDRDDGRIGQRQRTAAIQLADLVSDEAGGTRSSRPFTPGSTIHRAELNGSDWTSVQWAINGPGGAEIVDYIVEPSRTTGGRTLFGMEIRLDDQSIRRLMLDLAKPGQRARRKPVGLWSIQVAVACHRTFASPWLFDLHRAVTDNDGRCIKPSDVVCQSGPNEGQRLIFFRDGMWRGRELTPIERARLQRSRNQEATAND